MKRLTPFVIFIVLIIIGGLFWWHRGLSPMNKSDKEARMFIVQKGEGVKSIGENLKEQGLIRDPLVFYILAKQLGIERKIQAGSYRISPSQSLEQIAKTMTVGTQDIWVTIPEGQRA